MRTEYSVTLEEAGNSDAEIITDDIGIIAVTVSFPDGSGTAKVQTTTDTNDIVENHPDQIVWSDWPSGSVTETVVDYARAPNAIRLVNEDSTPAKMTIRGNYGS